MSMASLSEIENLKTENAQLRKLVQQLEASVRGSRVEVEDLILLLAFEDEHNTALSQQITDLGHTPVPPPRDSTSEDSVPKPTPTPTLNGSATEEAQAYNTDANAIQSVGSYADVNTSMASQSTGSVSGTSSRDELRGLEAPVAETVSKSLPNSIPNLSEGTRDSVSSTHDTTHMRTPSLPMTQPYSQQPPSSMPQQIYQDQTQITGPAPPQAQTQPTQPPPQRQAPGPVFNGLDRSEHSGQNSYQYDSTAPYSHPPAGATNSTLAQPYGANTGAPPNNGQPTQYRPPTLFTGSQEQFGSGERQTFSLR
ncbi:hypothetical protein SARC_01476 [Sphaeroforma arctica JP610]|uniref:Uncharacterized protein n=1 Tax=Sphaeroforma arctica JP610 TaxID=667725 RepID=A0A0L0GBW1_9EUKA|nr:hypothetical protein SARC_01476 [Sphaeroforma arctica JP610]KNC86381.1 hypothetical protein SARC_01476 [Sphaeroforma arctica JP610]|eukprot:XP_014160283.1 hypothetical protein SARC_01476 [Sphaeroforma arctica JP610]